MFVVRFPTRSDEFTRLHKTLRLLGDLPNLDRTKSKFTADRTS